MIQRSIVLYNSFFSFFGSSDRWSDAFAPAGRGSSLHCPQGVALGYVLLPLLGVE